jgi:hypothetical protein
MSAPVINGVVAPKDTTVTLTGSAQVACPVNTNRSHLQFQAPVGGLWYSFTNPSCAPGATGCFSLAPGVLYQPQGGVPQNALYFYGTNGQLVPLTEC